jgi:hypothetical protein
MEGRIRYEFNPTLILPYRLADWTQLTKDSVASLEEVILSALKGYQRVYSLNGISTVILVLKKGRTV